MNAENLAKSLGKKFLEMGSYTLQGGRFGAEVSGASASSLNIKNEYAEFDLGLAGLAVQSVGYTKGAEEESVVVYVTKGSQKALKAISRPMQGIDVVVKNVGKLKASPAPASSVMGNSYFFERNGRVACGSSCAPSGEKYSGTVGAFAKIEEDYFALSNNHVFAACNHTPVGMPILAPSASDGQPKRPAPSELCIYEGMAELRSGVPGPVPPLTMDAAFARVRNPHNISSWQGDLTTGFDTPALVLSPSAGLRVKKFGRTTGLTLGTIEAFMPTPWVLPYVSSKFKADAWFENTWTIRGDDGEPFALPGDSGSLVVSEDGSAALGLIFAVNTAGGYAIFCELAPILSAFGNMELLTNHGI